MFRWYFLKLKIAIETFMYQDPIIKMKWYIFVKVKHIEVTGIILNKLIIR